MFDRISKKYFDYLMLGRVLPSCYYHLSKYLNPDIFDKLTSIIYSSPLIQNHQKLKLYHNYFFFDYSEKESCVNILRKNYQKFAEWSLEKADLILNHEVDLLGSGPIKLDSKINWHYDFKSGYKWDPVFYKDIKRIRYDDQSDIKIPWELNRFQHLNILGQAYWISGNEKYAKEFVDQVVDWIENNPPRIGVNWFNSMEVAIRLVNWISAYSFFQYSPSFTQAAKKAFFNSILIHQLYIYHNLELNKRDGTFLNGNHFITDLIGLIIPFIVFPNLISKRIGQKALKMFYQEIRTQINEDGVHYELSIGYHRLISEILLSFIIIMMKNRIQLPIFIVNLTQKMLEFVKSYMKPNGFAPQVRDNDDGRLFTFSPYSLYDHRYLLNIGAVIFNRPDFKAAFPSFSYEALWWLGPDGFKKFNKMPKTKMENNSKIYEKSGFIFMKNSDNYLIGLCAGIGINGYGSHGHNDALSFELFAKGRDVLVDPGTYVYSAKPEWRNIFRSTSYHNTIRIDDAEINTINPGRLFSLPEEAHPRFEKWRITPNYDYMIGSHSGFHQLYERVVHKRMIVYFKTQAIWKIIDHIKGSGYHSIEIYFHFGSTFTANRLQDNNSILLEDDAGFQFFISMEDKSEWELELKKGWISKSYGIKESAWITCYRKRLTCLPVKTSFILKTYNET